MKGIFHVSSNIYKLWLLLCYLRVPFQLASLPGFHVVHVQKGNLVCMYMYMLKKRPPAALRGAPAAPCGERTSPTDRGAVPHHGHPARVVRSTPRDGRLFYVLLPTIFFNILRPATYNIRRQQYLSIDTFHILLSPSPTMSIDRHLPQSIVADNVYR